MKRFVVAVAVLAACGGDAEPIKQLDYATIGPLAGDVGRGGFRFGAASAATQIEDMNVATDWYLWTQPVADGGLGKGTFVGDATRGFSKFMEDIALVRDLGLDSYRFSIEWARIEPAEGEISRAQLAHYRRMIDT